MVIVPLPDASMNGGNGLDILKLPESVNEELDMLCIAMKGINQ